MEVLGDLALSRSEDLRHSGNISANCGSSSILRCVAVTPFLTCLCRISHSLVAVMGTLWTLQSSQPGLSLYSRLPLAYGTSFYSISLGLNVILTFLIIVRLVFYRRHLMKSLPEEFASHYVSLATIVVESAALYSIFAILFLITYAVDDPSNQILLAFASTAQVSPFRTTLSPKQLIHLVLAASFPLPDHLPPRRRQGMGHANDNPTATDGDEVRAS